MALTIQTLNQNHDINSFSCEEPPLTDWLKNTAGQHAKKGISKTYVLVDDPGAPTVVVGYYALTVCSIIGETLPKATAKKLPRTVPAFKLGRLARNDKFRGQGIGELLLLDAMKRVKAASNQIGGFALFVDAKNQKAIDFYIDFYIDFGFIQLPDKPDELFLPIASFP